MSSPLVWLHALRAQCRRPILLTVVMATGIGVCAIVQAALLAHILHSAVIEGFTRELLLPYIIALTAVLLLRAFLAWGREISGQRSSTLVRRFVRRELLEQFTAAGPMAVQPKHTAELTSSIIERIEALHGYFAHYLPQKAVALTVPVLIILTAFSVSWAVGLIFLITAPLVPGLMIMIGRGAENLSQKNFQLLSRMSAHFLDTLRGLATLKLFMRAQEETNRIASSSEKYRKGTMAVLRVAFLSSAVLEFFTSVAIAMTAVFLGLSYLHYLDFGLYGNQLTLRTGLFLLLLAPEVYLPLRELGTHFHARADALGAAAELNSLLKDTGERPENTDPPQMNVTRSIALELRHVSQQYIGRTGPALNDLCLSVGAGEWVAIVGASGAGKTTLLNLLLGFLPLQRGEIIVNGRSVANLDSDEWHRHIAWVPQQPQLFLGSLAENIKMGNPDLSLQQLQTAAEQANLHPDDQLVHGLATEVGEQGCRLSGGQVRRVALARAFAKDAPLLLLDEPTAGLDLENERLIMASLERLRKDRTVIMLTHRLDTARLADRIAVMADGMIVEQGSHQQLLERNGVYAGLVTGGTGIIS
ncbi:MAG: thiol reductant ABC exporter subunit CydD [Desulforhopalus sp.]